MNSPARCSTGRADAGDLSGGGAPSLPQSIAARLASVSFAACVLVAVFGASALVGWALDVSVLKSVVPGQVTMKVNTAVGLVLAGIALALRAARPERRRVARAAAGLGWIVAAIGVVTLVEYLLPIHLGIDQLVFADVDGAAQAGIPGRMAPTTALGFVLLGCALGWPDPRALVARRLAWVGLASLALFGVIGHAYGLGHLIDFGPATSMALNTAGAFVLAAVALASAPPADRVVASLVAGREAGWMLARRLLPIAILLPILLGWVRLAGQRAGLYSTEVGLTLYSFANVLVLGATVGWTALVLNRRDREGRTERQRFLATFEQAAVGIAHVAPDGRWLRVNTKLCEIVGYAREELLAKTFQDITHPDDLASDLGQVRRVLAGEIATYAMEKRYFHKGGDIVWINLTVSLVRDAAGAPDYFISVVEDITRRKVAEQAAATLAARLRCLHDANLIGILVTDLGDAITQANDAFLNTVGMSRESIAAGGVRFADLVDPDQRSRYQRAVEVVRSGVSVPAWETDLRHGSRGRVHVLVGMSRVEGADTCVGFVLDLSDRQELEEKLRHAQRVEVVGRLAGGIAHDFNNLLTPILGYSDLIRTRLPAGDPLREDADEIADCGKRAAELARQLLALSRRQVLHPRQVMLNSIVTSVRKMLQRIIGDDIRFEMHLAPDLGTARLDPGQIEQILMNLAVNARDAMPQGGTITVETANVDLDPEYAERHVEVEPGPYVLLTVSDTGKGMSPETKAHVFEPYFTTKEVGKGTGLGLAIVHGIVKQSQGHITVYSEVDHGTTFKVYLPRSNAPADEPDAPHADLSASGGTETILVTEDDAALRKFVVNTLRGLGYTVLEAADGRQGRAVARAYPGGIDLLITDLIMPGMNGRETATAVRETRPNLEVLFMSGYTANVIAHQGVLDAGTHFLAKPFTAGSLTRKIREVLEVRR